MNENKKVGINEQDAPHKEGQYGNTSASPNAEENVSMGMSQMKEEDRGVNDRNGGTPTEQNKTPGTDGR